MRNVLLLWIAFVGSATAQFTGDLRLVRNGLTSSSYTSGRLEVYYSGQWGTVCDDNWDSSNTRVACRQLGLSTFTTSWTTSSSGGFGSTTRPIWLDNVNCFGTESRLTSCSRNSYGSHNCGHSEDVAIYCGTSSSGPSTGDLRLVRNGLTSSSYTSGRLEVYYSGQWGTVCDDFWDSSNTRVACRQLGLSTFTTSWTRSSSGGFGSTSRPIWLDNVNCIGTESRLTSCSRNSYGDENCGHSEDVAIYCGTSSGGSGSSVSSAVSIGVGVSISSLVVFVIIPIVICVVIACAASRSSSRQRTTVTTVPSTPSTTVVTTSSQQQSAQQSAYPAAGTDLKQAPPPPYEMSAYPPQPQGAYPQQGYPQQGYPQQAYPPQGYPPQGYPPQGYPPQPEGAYPPQGYPAQGYPPQP